MINCLIKFLVILVVFPCVLLAQKPDSIKESIPQVTENQKIADSTITIKARKAENTKKLVDFIDKNANGIDDRLEKKAGKEKGKPMGRGAPFIDKNGDGICDGRESAIGLRKTHRRRKGKSP